jgi:hypothetical protein
MKKILFVATALVFASPTLFAQSVNGNVGISTGQAVNPAAESQAKDATDKLNNVVQLSSDQYNQVLQVNRNYFNRPASPVGRGAARQGYGRESQLKSILTSDQWQRYEAAKQQGQTF